MTLEPEWHNTAQTPNQSSRCESVRHIERLAQANMYPESQRMDHYYNNDSDPQASDREEEAGWTAFAVFTSPPEQIIRTDMRSSITPNRGQHSLGRMQIWLKWLRPISEGGRRSYFA